MTNYTLFLQYRPDIISDEDRVFIQLHHFNEIEAASNWTIDATDPRPVEEGILIFEALEIIRNFVPLYCKEGDMFFTLARNMSHDVHHRLDFERVLELTSELSCTLDDIVIIECIPEGPDFVRYKPNVQSAAVYFSRFV